MIHQLSYLNHLKWGMNNVEHALRQSPDDIFFVEPGKISRFPKTFRDECIETAKIIDSYCRQINKSIALLYSGGLDSEVMLAAFLSAGIKFDIFHLNCSQGLLDHETKYVKTFCDRYGLTYIPVTFDLVNYMETEGFNLTLSIRSTEIKTSHVLFLMKTLASTHLTVVGNGEPWLHMVDNRFIFAEYESMFAWYNFPYHNNFESVPGFFQYTPEITLSFFLDPFIEMLRDKLWSQPNIRLLKYYIYKHSFPEFNFEKRIKYSGHDILPASFYQQKYIELQSKLNLNKPTERFFNPNLSHVWWEVDDIINNLFGKSTVLSTYRQNHIGQEYSGQYHQ